MNIYDILDRVLENQLDKSTYYFRNEEDVINTLGGIILCGELKENYTYLVCTDEHLCEKCDFVVYDCGTYHYAYIVEE